MIATDNGAGVVLGTLRTESRVFEDIDGQGSWPRTMCRPELTPVLNDGRSHYWMMPGEDYDIGYDGRGWRVTCRTWEAGRAGHTYRLAAPAHGMATSLPVGDGAVPLGPGSRYRLRTSGFHEWVEDR